MSGVESLTLAIGLQMVWTGPYLPHPHQLTEVSHQLTQNFNPGPLKSFWAMHNGQETCPIGF